MVTCDTILQENMPGEAVGKAFGFREMASKAAFGVAGIASGITVDIIGPRSLLVVLGIAAIAYSALSLVLLADTTKLNLLNAYPLLRAGSALASSLPRRVSYRLASVLSGVAFVVLPDKRARASENGSRVIGQFARKPGGQGAGADDVQELRALLGRLLRTEREDRAARWPRSSAPRDWSTSSSALSAARARSS